MSGDRYEREVVRIALLAGDNGVVEGKTFEGCQINGPAVIAPSGSTFRNSTFNAPDPDSLLWELPPNRAQIVGAVLVKDCTFLGCTFTRVGLTGNRETLDQFRGQLGS